MIFDGRAEAKRIEEKLIASGRLVGKSLLILQCDGEEKESTYVRLKREMGERLGVMVRTQGIKNSRQLKEKLKSKEIGGFDGVLVQLPILGAGRDETEEILTAIVAEKDVDGLNRTSNFRPAAILAVLRILKIAGVQEGRRIGVVGAEGLVGRRLMRDLGGAGYSCLGFDLGDDLAGLLACDTIVSATGVANLIQPEMVREGIVAIDLGYPKGEFSSEVSQKADFFTPVPGGVGPMTIICLFENLSRV
ncbi:bifunctional 5,10-methylenetetrahydrofolate dehydrogenase/5,10-methenyltetrahydrofolate cyclohydrolase [Candidatus Collierbacteria bacterium]|nr:bifunctional 5,10-methylenetetrahydrofolate dehydrogenase/5,10-methenyltetrahydrofolate cyclohydrolase [Candidatus Collierbacteria bacterium]